MKRKSRIEETFELLKEQNKKALIPFITCGDPDIDTTYQLVLKMEQAGANIIELGIPYSDPLADGEIIQRASNRALSAGVNIEDCLELVERLRTKTQIPLLFLVYYNPVFKYGIHSFISKCIEVGVDGMVIPDLPLEEREDLDTYIQGKPFNIISLVAPTSGDRIKEIVSQSRGFIYCVSSKGVTGKRASFEVDLENFLLEIKKYTDIPTAIGFGISDRKTVEKLKTITDGIIVGSAIVEKIEQGLKDHSVIDKVFDFVSDLHEGIEIEDKR